MRGVIRSDRRIVQPERYFTVAILSGAFSVISLLATLLTGSFASDRNLGARQVVKLFAHAAAVERSEIVVLHYLAITGLVAGLAGCVTALAIYIRS